MRRRQGRKNKTIGQTSFQREQEVAPKLMDFFEAELERRRNSPRASEDFIVVHELISLQQFVS